MSDLVMAPPSRVLRDLEVVRALVELGAHVAARGALPLLPRGDRHGVVLVLPGFMAGESSTWPLRDLLRRLGHDARSWGLGRNLGPTTRIVPGLARRLRRLHAEAGQRVTLVGVSLGGVMARGLAHEQPDLVRQVITLGSPFALPADSSHRNLTHVTPLYHALQPWHAPPQSRPPRTRGAVLPVPSTAIYTRTDGIVPWASTIQPAGPCSENVEVWGSHCGLGHNPLALAVVADRVAQPLGAWEPFRWDRLAEHARQRLRADRPLAGRPDATSA